MSFYQQIKDQVSDLREEFEYANDGTAFGHFIISECFNKIIDFSCDETNFEQYVNRHIVDLSNDCGNDAIFTSIASKQIYLFQFKYSQNPLLNTDEIRKNKSFIDWLLGISNETILLNRKIRNIIDGEISNIINEQTIRDNDFEIIFNYIDNSFSDSTKADIMSLFSNYRDKGIQFQVKYYDYEDMRNLYEDTEIPKNEIDLQIVPEELFIKKMTYYDETEKSTEIETIVTSVKANSLKKIVEQYKELLFALNVRYYKGENEINTKIRKEYSKGSKSNFWLLNNGINAVCSDYKINDGLLKVLDYQIVNGGQTTKTLAKIINELPDSVHVLMKLSKIKESSLTCPH